MSLVLVGFSVARMSFPRVSGDEPGLRVYKFAYYTFSPRERG